MPFLTKFSADFSTNKEEKDFINKDIETIKESKSVSIILDSKDFLETATEKKYKKLALNKFPIKYSLSSRYLSPDKIVNLGATEVDFGFEKLSNVQIRLFEYPKFNMIEFKKRDFKFSLGVNEKGTILLRSNDMFEYEIHEDIKNNRLRVILEFLIKLTSGTAIKFHISNVICDMHFFNHNECFKFKTVLESLDIYENLVKVYSLNKNKDLASANISFYELSTLDTNLHFDSIDTWINFNSSNNYGLNVGDMLCIKREHNFNLKSLPFNLVEKIELIKPLEEKDLRNNKIQLNNKTVKISFEKIKK